MFEPPVAQLTPCFINTHINGRQRSTEALRFHPQQVLELGHHHVHGRRSGEASHQRLCEVDGHETKPEKTEDELEEE